MLLKPDRLNRGDKVGIFVPSSSVKDVYRIKGLKKIREMGFIPVEVEDILSKKNFLAKSPEKNFNDIQKFLLDDKIKVLWAARGGYGSNYLLPLISKIRIIKPKIIIGSSDISYLLWYLLDHFKMTVFYGPMAFSSLAENRVDLENLMMILEGNYSEIRVSGNVLKHGSSIGIIAGGCLSNFTSLIGTEYLPDIKGKILLLEDTNERPYRLDRMLWQIFESGIFAKVKGLILGEFPSCFKNLKEKNSFFSHIKKYLEKFDFPIIYDLPFGHSSNIHTLPLGIEVEIDTGCFSGLIIKERGVQ